MKTVRDILTLSTQYLESHGVDRARRESEELLCDALDVTRIGLYIDLDRPLQETELSLCRTRLARRAKGEPSAYIHGSVDFCDCTLEVNSHVLIPRQETALLVDHIAKALEAEERVEEKIVWDVCCGSGCIGLALKKRFPDLQVILSDLSEEATATTVRNAARNALEVTVLQGDLLHPFVQQRCHYFVCNPPYISEAAYSELSPEVRDFEPRLALVGGADGLDVYRSLAASLSDYLHPHSRVYFEIGYDQGKALQELFADKPWKQQQVIQDWAGHDRFFSLENE